MLFLIAFVGAAVIALVLWKAMNTVHDEMPRRHLGTTRGPSRSRASGPDDDPDFLRRLAEQVRRRDDPPPS